MHTEDFHKVVPESKGCVTCQGYHPICKPLDQTYWMAKQNEVIDVEINRIVNDVDELCEFLKIKRSTPEQAFLQYKKASEEVMTAKQDVDESS